MLREMFESLQYARHCAAGVGGEYGALSVSGTSRRKVLSTYCALGPWDWGTTEHQLCAWHCAKRFRGANV